jgi:peptidoglycan/LPS O-acetylase OafA/YrhL
LLPGIFSIPPVITVAWSLSYEIFFYLAIPLLVSLFWLRSWPTWARVAFFLAAVVLAQSLALPYPRMGMFACGMILAEVLPRVTQAQRWHRALDGLALAAWPLAAAAMLIPLPAPAAFAALFAAGLALCLAALSHRGLVAASLSFRPLRWLGNISYSYYLLHGLVLKALFLGLGLVLPSHHSQDWLFWMLLGPAFAATLGGSTLLFLLVERPFSILPAERRSEAPAGMAAQEAASRG